jgi:hypothetical protein
LKTSRKSIHGMKVEIDQIKAKQNKHHRILAVEEEHHHNIEDRVIFEFDIGTHC